MSLVAFSFMVGGAIGTALGGRVILGSGYAGLLFGVRAGPAGAQRLRPSGAAASRSAHRGFRYADRGCIGAAREAVPTRDGVIEGLGESYS